MAYLTGMYSLGLLHYFTGIANITEQKKKH